MEANVKFKVPGASITINGQKFHDGNLTQEDYEYLVSWSKDFASQFVPKEKVEDKPKNKKDGKEEN